MPAGAIFGGLFAWPVSDYLGRQASLMIGGVPSLIGWILISLSVIFTRSMYFILMILIGRFFTGFSSGWSVYCVSVSYSFTIVQSMYCEWLFFSLSTRST